MNFLLYWVYTYCQDRSGSIRESLLLVLSSARHAISGPRIESLAQSIDRPSMELAQVMQLAMVLGQVGYFLVFWFSGFLVFWFFYPFSFNPRIDF